MSSPPEERTQSSPERERMDREQATMGDTAEFEQLERQLAVEQRRSDNGNESSSLASSLYCSRTVYERVSRHQAAPRVTEYDVNDGITSPSAATGLSLPLSSDHGESAQGSGLSATISDTASASGTQADSKAKRLDQRQPDTGRTGDSGIGTQPLSGRPPVRLVEVDEATSAAASPLPIDAADNRGAAACVERTVPIVVSQPPAGLPPIYSQSATGGAGSVISSIVPAAQQPRPFVRAPHVFQPPPVSSAPPRVQPHPAVPPASSYVRPTATAFVRPPVPQQRAQAERQPAHIEAYENRLRAAIVRFEKLHSELVQKEKLLSEAGERALTDQKAQLQAERDALHKEKADLEQYKNSELQSIKRERDQLERQRTVLQKEGTEREKLLKEQIERLQGEICERDTRLSSQRAKLKQNEKDIDRLSSQLKAKTAECARAQQRCAAAENANSQLRLRGAKLAAGALVRGQTQTAPAKPPLKENNRLAAGTAAKAQPVDGGGSKQVRFAAPQASVGAENTVASCSSSGNSTDLLIAAAGAAVRPQLPAIAECDDKVTQTCYLSPMARRGPTGPLHHSLSAPSVHQPTQINVTSEQIDVNGIKETVFSNGTRRILGTDGRAIFHYANGDWRQIAADGAEIYYYASERTTVYTDVGGTVTQKFEDGTEIIQRTDGSREHRQSGGCVRSVSPGGTETRRDGSGAVTVRRVDGTQLVTFPDRSVETRMGRYVERVFPDGCVRNMLPDGTLITRYPDGRLRVKDKDGQLLVDEYVTFSSSSTDSGLQQQQSNVPNDPHVNRKQPNNKANK